MAHVKRLVALAVLVGCGGKTAGLDARSAPNGRADAAAAIGSGSGSGSGVAKQTGDAQVRVEWKDPPAPVRTALGRDACGTPNRAAVEPTSTWGIPDVAVWIDGAPTAGVPASVRVVIGPCLASPRVTIAHPGATLAITSAVERPLSPRVVHYGEPGQGAIKPSAPTTPLQLPVIGHEVDLALAAPALDDVEALESDAWVVTTATAAGVTDAQGQVVLRDLPVGAHAVTALLPKRGTTEARVARGKLDVLPGGLAELTLDLGAPALTPQVLTKVVP